MIVDSTEGLVGVNLLWCRPGAVGGSEEYLVRQLIGVANHGFRARLFAPKGFTAAHPRLVELHDVVESRHDSSSRGRRIVTESTWLRRRTRRLDAVHHGGGTLPARRVDPTVLTIHDLQYRKYPQYFSRARRTYLEAVMPRSARRATLITVPTHYVKTTVVDAFGVDPLRVVVVPHGVDDSLNAECTPGDELRRRFSLGDGPIVVYPAVTHPHKNHEFLIDVADRHWSHLGVRLVLMGGAGAADQAVRRRLLEPRVANAVIHVGRVSDADRNGLIRMAQAMAFPSEYEGFGAPVIEAMQLGTPVVASDQACLPEVVGDAGLVLALQEDLWAGLPDLVRTRRTDLVQRGIERVREYSIDESGRALADAYRMVLP